MRIKDIPIWGTVQEGRVLPVRRAEGAPAITALGPVLDPPTLAVVQRAEAPLPAHHHTDSCTLAQGLARAIQAHRHS